MSRSGLVVAAVYVVLATASIVFGHGLANPKDSTVMMQLPLVPALIIVDALGLTKWLDAAPLVVSCGLLVSAVASGLYAVCWLFGALGFRTRLAIGVGVAAVLSFLLFWPSRP